MPGTDPSKPTVLVVDPSAESRLVLCELLTRTGIETTETGSVAGASLSVARSHTDMVLVDGDAIDPSELGILAKAAGRKNALIVVAGTNRPTLAAELGLQFIRKPYHYRELVHKIWSALEATNAQARAAA